MNIKIDPSTIRFDARVETIDKLFIQNKYNLKFKQINNTQKITTVIESILCRFPLPVIYIYYCENQQSYQLLNNKTFIYSINSFLENINTLEKCSFLNLENSSFSNLKKHEQRRILETYINIQVIERGTPLETINTLKKYILEINN